MGRQIVADIILEAYLKSLCKAQAITIGLMIGQPSNVVKDFVIHFAQTSKPISDETKLQTLLQVDSSAIVEHVLNVLKMLPGGSYIIGLFVIGPKDIFTDANDVQKLKSLIINVEHTIKSNPMLLGNCNDFDNGEKLVLWYSSSNNSYSCKSISSDSSKSVLPKSVDFKFAPKTTQLIEIETFYEVDEVFRIDCSDMIKTDQALIIPFESLKNVMVDSKIFLNGAPQNKSYILEIVAGDSKIIQAQVYQSCQKAFSDDSISVQAFNQTVKICGNLSSRIWISNKSNVSEAEKFIKEDILRTLGTRIQVLTDSLIENNILQDEVIINEPPRRIYLPAKLDTFKFCDYLFSSESNQSILQQIKENLDLDLNVDQIQDNIEKIGGCAFIKTNDSNLSPDSQELKRDHGKIYVYGIIIAIIILIVSILLHYFIH